MDILIFAPAILCIAGLWYWGPQKTFLTICLPILLLFPTYFYYRIQGFPEQDFGTTVMLPLGAALVPLVYARWKFTRADLWLLAYVFSAAYADFRLGQTSLAKYRLFDVVVGALIPYMAGKLLIEPVGARYETAKRLILILVTSCIFAMPEFVLKFNFFLWIGMRVFPGQLPGWWTQVRGGFGRVAGPFGTAEVYGLILIIGVLLLFWVKKWASPLRPFTRVSWLTPRQGIVISLVALGMTLYMTQSRGPWFGTLVALPVAFIGRARRVRRAALLTALAFMVIAVPGYLALKNYSSGPRKNYGSEQETAQYRRDLIESYLPLGEQGGLWGWGTFHPVRGRQTSIDNEFLRVFVVQGYVGVFSYMLLILEAIYVLARVGFSAETGEERHFCFTLLAIFAGWVFTLSTVYMGSQSYPLFFILVGWSQGMSRVPASVSARVKDVLRKEEQLHLERVCT